MYEKFSKLLHQRGLRPSDVSRATGINSAVFSEWKRGKSTPKTDKLVKLAEFFEVPLEYFTSCDDNKKSTSPDEKRSAAIRFVENMTDAEYAQYESICRAIYGDKFPG